MRPRSALPAACRALRTSGTDADAGEDGMTPRRAAEGALARPVTSVSNHGEPGRDNGSRGPRHAPVKQEAEVIADP